VIDDPSLLLSSVFSVGNIPGNRLKKIRMIGTNRFGGIEMTLQYCLFQQFELKINLDDYM
jgi:hypothetical protein